MISVFYNKKIALITVAFLFYDYFAETLQTNVTNVTSQIRRVCVVEKTSSISHEYSMRFIIIFILHSELSYIV